MRKIKLKRMQKGLSPIGVLFMVMVFAFILMLFFKLAPHYLNFWTLRTVYTEVGDIPGINKQSVHEIENILAKRLIINSFRDFDPRKDSYVGKEDGVLKLQFEYEIKEHMIGNVDVLLSFDHLVEVNAE